MSNIPLNVKTKMMAFDDSTATAPDRLTGEKNIVAFRACNLSGSVTDNRSVSTAGKSIILYFLLNIHNMFLVPWQKIDYNIGNYFDGTIFTAPKTGLYTFFAKFLCQAANHQSYGSFYVNGTQKIYSQWAVTDHGRINCILHATLKLTKDDKVEVRLSGKLFSGSNDTCYFEGRLISLIAD